MTALKSPFRVLAVAFGLGCATDLLFYGHSLGVSVILFVLLLLASIAALSRVEGVGLARRNLWLVEPLLFFAGMLFVRANPTLTLVNLLAVLALLGVLFYFITADRLERLGVAGYPAVLWLGVRRSVAGPVQPVSQLVSRVSARRSNFSAFVPVLRGVVIAIPVLILFSALLASADLFFARYLQDLLDMRLASDLPELLLRFSLILTASWLCAGAMLFALVRGKEHAGQGELYSLPGAVSLPAKLGFLEVVTVLALVDLLFAAFAWVQFAFLFSGKAARTMGYQAYRDYVREGFGQLLVVAVLSMGLILGLKWVARFDQHRQASIFNSLCTAMIALTLVMLVSAFWRMLVWENIEFYINTPLRIYIRVFIVFLGLTFAWLFFTLWFKRERFAIGAFVAALAFLMTINIINPDADVAAYNLSHRGDELATRYLYLLSDDAVPALVEGLRSSDSQGRSAIQADLERRLASMEVDTQWRDWQSFHLAHWEAYDLLNNLRSSGQIGAPPAQGHYLRPPIVAPTAN